MSVETISAGGTNPVLTAVEAKPAVSQPPQPVPTVAQSDATVVKEDELAKSLEQIQVMMDLRNRAVEFTTDEVSGA